MRLVYWLLAGCFLTASFDLTLIFDVGGQVRISQIFLIFLCLIAIGRTLQDGRILWPRGATALCLWLLSQFVFLPVALLPGMALRFLLLTVLTIAGTFAVVQLYGRSRNLEPVMRVYLLSYVVIGCFGLIQFILPLFRINPPFVVQWISHGRIARINGFNYEPSYYITYLMMGWIALVDLRYSKAKLTQGKKWKWATYLVTASLFLSTSRSAWIIMFVELAARTAPVVWAAVHSAWHQSREGRMLVRLPRARLVVGAAAFLVVIAGAIQALFTVVTPLAFLAGTGIGGTAAHSYNDRSGNAVRTFIAFAEHPFVGRTLGGIAPYMASRDGITVHSLEEARLYQGFPVPFEVLMASGIFGAIPFFIYVYRNSFGAMRLARTRWPDEQARWLRALGRATVFEWLTLLTDQNLLRVYLWFHMTVVTLVAYNLEYIRLPKAETADDPAPALALPSGSALEASSPHA